MCVCAHSASLNPDTDMVYSPNIPFQVLVPRGFVLDGIIHVSTS